MHWCRRIALQCRCANTDIGGRIFNSLACLINNACFCLHSHSIHAIVHLTDCIVHTLTHSHALALRLSAYFYRGTRHCCAARAASWGHAPRSPDVCVSVSRAELWFRRKWGWALMNFAFIYGSVVALLSLSWANVVRARSKNRCGISSIFSYFIENSSRIPIYVHTTVRLFTLLVFLLEFFASCLRLR